MLSLSLPLVLCCCEKKWKMADPTSSRQDLPGSIGLALFFVFAVFFTVVVSAVLVPVFFHQL
jgi:hypothetical protein